MGIETTTVAIERQVTETYLDVENMIHTVVHTFLRKKKIVRAEYDEWHGEACVAFSVAYESFDYRLKNRFTTWLWCNIWHTLSAKLRREAPHWTTPNLSYEASNKLIDRRRLIAEPSFDIQALSEDAKVVVRIVFDVFGHMDGKKEGPREIRMALRNLLCGMGWSAQRVIESFDEIRTALTK